MQLVTKKKESLISVSFSICAFNKISVGYKIIKLFCCEIKFVFRNFIIIHVSFTLIRYY